MKNKKYTIGIIGGGSIGLTFAAFLADYANIIIKTRSQKQAEKIASKGINLIKRPKVGNETHQIVSGIDATSDASKLSHCDGLIVTVKSYDAEQVAKELSTIIKSTTEILTVQNGLQAYDLMKRNTKNPERVFSGITYIASIKLDDNSVSVGFNVRTIVDAKAIIWGKILRESQIEFESTNDIKQAVWDKMVLNTGQNALGAITNLSFEKMRESAECLKIAKHLLEEFEKIATAEGVSFSYSLFDKLKDNWKMSKHHPSMWQDLQNKKRTEIDAINGAISSFGKKHGIATPYNDMITSLIKILEKN